MQQTETETSIWPYSEHLDPATLIDNRGQFPVEIEHSPSLMPSAVSVRSSDSVPPSSFSMASFGIVADPDGEARRKRGMFFGVGVAIFLAIAALMLRSSGDAPVAKAKEDKPPPAAAAPPPPAAPAPPAVVAEKPKDEAKPATPDDKKSADADEDKEKSKGKVGKNRHRHAKAKAAH